MLRKFAALALMPFAVACGSSSIAISDLAQKYAQTECTKLVACCSGDSSAPTEASCEASVAAFLQPEFTQLQADAHVTYNGSAANDCLNDFANGTCVEENAANVPASCNEIFVGNVANGGSCVTGYDCTSTFCSGIQSDSSGNVTTPGTCTAQVAAGATCTASGVSFGSPCLPGSYLDFSSQCTCDALLANGAACSGSEQCASGYCDTSGTAYTCTTEPQVSSLSASECMEAFQGLTL